MCSLKPVLPDKESPYPRICAHRGFHTVLPENSLPGIASAIVLGADEVEMDLWQTADHEAVIFHDTVLDRVTDETGLVTEKTLSQLKKADLGFRRDPSLSGLRILTLEEVLRHFGKKIIINLHLRFPDYEKIDPAFLRKVFDLIRAYDCMDHIYVCGFASVCAAVRKVCPEIALCMATGPDRSKMDAVENAIKYQCAKVQLFMGYFTQEMIEKAHKHSIRCNYCLTDDPSEGKELLKRGFDTLLTNNFLQVAQGVFPERYSFL